jgi:hypothetical protein
MPMWSVAPVLKLIAVMPTSSHPSAGRLLTCDSYFGSSW